MSTDSPIRRDVGVVALMLTGLVSIIGAGWLLFGWDLLVVAVAGAVFFCWGVTCGGRTPDLEAALRA